MDQNMKIANRTLITQNYRRDFLASIVVFLVALPLCMGIAIASGVPVAAGLITGIIGGLVVGWFAGAPLQVSGPAAGLTVIIFDLVQRHGLEVLGIIDWESLHADFHSNAFQNLRASRRRVA